MFSFPCFSDFAARGLLQAWDAQAHANCRSTNASRLSCNSSLEQDVKLYKTPSSLQQGVVSAEYIIASHKSNGYM